jgi:hypothetical protein
MWVLLGGEYSACCQLVIAGSASPAVAPSLLPVLRERARLIPELEFLIDGIDVRG